MTTGYRLKLHKQVEKFLASLTPAWKVRFRDRLDDLRHNPYPHPEVDIKPMQAMGESVYRLRVGHYRLIYEVRERELVVYLMTAGSRGDVYK